MQSDPTTIDYFLFYTTGTVGGRRVKVALKTDEDLFRMLYEDKNDQVISVIEKMKQTPQAVHHTRDDVPHSQRSRIRCPINVSGPSSTLDDDFLDEDKAVSTDEVDYEDKDEDENFPSELLESLITEFSACVCKPGQMDNFLDRTGLGDHNFSRSVHLGGDDEDDGAAGRELRN